MKRYQALILLIVLIILSVVTLKLSDKRIKLALEDKCKVVLDHDCLEYGNCKCKE